MLIIMMALIGAVALIVVGLRRDKISLLILALCGSFIAMLAGIVIYTAKIGGSEPADSFVSASEYSAVFAVPSHYP